MYGRLTVGCDLMVRADDGPMLRRTLDEMLRLANDLDWFFQLRLPNRIHWMEAVQMEIQWEELPQHDLDSFLDDYFNRFPGDVLGAATVGTLQPEEE